MAFVNEGPWDRVIRILVGIVLLYAAWMIWPGTANILSSTGIVNLVPIVIGVIALVTGVVGWCPAYALFHVTTEKKVGA